MTATAVTINNDILTLTYEENAKTEAGSYTAKVTGISGEKAVNYVLEESEATAVHKWKIERDYTVTFDVNGHGTAPKAVEHIVSGSTIEMPEEPVEEGWSFEGWYKEKSCENPWKFETDLVTEDTTLYAKWTRKTAGKPSAPVLSQKTDTSITVKTVSGQVYSIDGGKNWNSSGTFENLKASTTYSIITKVSETKAAGESSVSDALKVTTNAAQVSAQEKARLGLNAGLKVSQTTSKVIVRWGTVDGADSYEIYATYCGNKTMKKIGTVGAKKTKFTFRELEGSKLNLKKNIKVYVAAYKNEGGKKVRIVKGIVAHIVGRKNATYTNVKKIKLAKISYTLKVNGKATIKATTVLVDKKKKMLSDAHAPEFRYASGNKSIAKVSKKGVIRAVAKGKCTIYVYAKNGYTRKIKVTVN